MNRRRRRHRGMAEGGESIVSACPAPLSRCRLPASRSLCGARSPGLALPGTVGLGADAALEVLVGCSSLPCARVPLVPTWRLFTLKPKGVSAPPHGCRSVPAFAGAGSFYALSLQVLSSLAVPLAHAFPFSSCEPCGLSGTTSRVRGRLGASSPLLGAC